MQRDLQAAADGGAVDGGQQRLGRGAQQVNDVVAAHRPLPHAFALQALEDVEIGAGAEIARDGARHHKDRTAGSPSADWMALCSSSTISHVKTLTGGRLNSSQPTWRSVVKRTTLSVIERCFPA